jgi:peptidyl-dipeptidase Dcp
MHPNPLFSPWTSPHAVPPFDLIEPAHFLPAYHEGIRLQLAEIEAITANPEPPTFPNTIEALERAGAFLARVADIFGNLNASHTNPELQAVAREVAPLMANHRSAIMLNAALFARVDAVHSQSPTLPPEANRLLGQTHKQFVRAGARLAPDAKSRLAAIDQSLASLTNQFEQNLLADTAAYELILSNEADVPPSLRATAQRDGHWVITLQRSSIEPFLHLSTRRDLRQTAFAAWAARGDNDNQYDNKALITEIVQLRRERAQLLGYPHYAAYSLADTMAKTPAAARALLDQLWQPALSAAQRETAELTTALEAEAIDTPPLEAWDWRYYAEKVRLAKYDLDEEQLKPYFPLDNMIEAAFWVATQLFGLSFRERPDLPVYHPDVRAWEVLDRTGAHVGIFYGDYYARPSKRSGAWMNSFRDQQRLAGDISPIVTNNLNFNKSPAGLPTLLSYDDATTLFHEFGHALHGLLSNVTYPSLSGTNVVRDWVEMPSQIYEHWLSEPAVLERFARHYETNDPLPAELLAKRKAAQNFNQGFAMIEYLASSYVDLEWHLLEDEAPRDVRESEAAWLAGIGMPREIIMRHRSPHFAHIFGSPTGYAAGYYSYRWSAVLDTDAFAAFEEKGDAFDPEVAGRLHRHIYASGGTADPMELYQAFRGREPNTGALMRSLGFA